MENTPPLSHAAEPQAFQVRDQPILCMERVRKNDGKNTAKVVVGCEFSLISARRCNAKLGCIHRRVCFTYYAIALFVACCVGLAVCFSFQSQFT